MVNTYKIHHRNKSSLESSVISKNVRGSQDKSSRNYCFKDLHFPLFLFHPQLKQSAYYRSEVVRPGLLQGLKKMKTKMSPLPLAFPPMVTIWLLQLPVSSSLRRMQQRLRKKRAVPKSEKRKLYPHRSSPLPHKTHRCRLLLLSLWPDVVIYPPETARSFIFGPIAVSTKINVL